MLENFTAMIILQSEKEPSSTDFTLQQKFSCIYSWLSTFQNTKLFQFFQVIDFVSWLVKIRRMTGRRTVHRQKPHKRKSELTVLLSLPAIDCGKLEAPQNGSIFGRDTTYPHALRFTCDVGFSLFGSSDRKCQVNGTWSGTNALCQGE